jgi:hypothetical protein
MTDERPLPGRSFRLTSIVMGAVDLTARSKLGILLEPNKNLTHSDGISDDVRSAFGIRGVSQHQEPTHDYCFPNNLEFQSDSFSTIDPHGFHRSIASDFGNRGPLGRNRRLRRR